MKKDGQIHISLCRYQMILEVEGLEPSRLKNQQILSLPRIPIPPHLRPS